MVHFLLIIGSQASTYLLRIPFYVFPSICYCEEQDGEEVNQILFGQLVCGSLNIRAKMQVLGKDAVSLPKSIFIFFKGHSNGSRQMSGRLHLRIFTPRLPPDGFTKLHRTSNFLSKALAITRGSWKL
jgi:hypothetical protein